MKKAAIIAVFFLVINSPYSTRASQQEKITLSVLDWNEGIASELQEAACQEYMDLHPEIRIDYQWLEYEEYQEALLQLIETGKAPDIFYASDLRILDYAGEGYVEELSALYQKEGLDLWEKFTAPAIHATGNGDVYGLSYGVVGMVLYYDKDVFDQAGVQYPSADPANPDTWEEWVKKLIRLTQDQHGNHPDETDYNPQAVRVYGTLLPSWIYDVEAFLISNGASYFNEEGFSLSDERGLEVLTCIQDLAKKYQVAPSLDVEETLLEPEDLFQEDRLACYIGGTYEYADILVKDSRIGVAPLPMFRRPATLGWAACCAISANTEHLREAFDFFRWYVEADTNPCHIATNMPNEYRYYNDESLYDLWMDPTIYQKDFRTLVPDLIQKYACQPEMYRVRNAGVVFEDCIAPWLDEIWRLEMDPETACNRIEEEIASIYSGFW